MSTSRNTTRLPARAVLTVVFFASVLALAVGVLGGREAAHATSPLESLRAQYAILRSTNASGLTAVASRQEAEKASGPVWLAQAGGPVVSTAREVQVLASGLRVWVAATQQGEICVLAMRTGLPGITGPGGTCASGKLGGNGTILEVPPTSTEAGYVVGAVPDGVATAVISSSDGSVENAPVSANVFALRLKSPTASVSFEQDGTTHTISAGGTQ